MLLISEIIKQLKINKIEFLFRAHADENQEIENKNNKTVRIKVDFFKCKYVQYVIS